MRKKFNAALIGTLLGTLVLTGIPAFAQEITIAGPPCTFTVTVPKEDGTTEEQEKEVEKFTIFGQSGEDRMLIRTDGGDEYVDKAALAEMLPELDLSLFPQVDTTTAVPRGTKGEAATALQNALTGLGFSVGAVDGDYGGGTAAAVQQFQEAHGLTGTGDADIYTMLLINGAAAGIPDSIEVSSKGYDSPEEKFPKIAGKTAADLNLFMEPKWRFSFDEIDDAGDRKSVV